MNRDQCGEQLNNFNSGFFLFFFFQFRTRTLCGIVGMDTVPAQVPHNHEYVVPVPEDGSVQLGDDGGGVGQDRVLLELDPGRDPNVLPAFAFAVALFLAHAVLEVLGHCPSQPLDLQGNLPMVHIRETVLTQLAERGRPIFRGSRGFTRTVAGPSN